MKNPFKEYRKKREFTAENCRRKQNLIDQSRYLQKLEEIRARIDFVVANSSDEHAVIYHIHKEQTELYNKIGEYFYDKGFLVIKTNIEGLQDEYLIISW